MEDFIRHATINLDRNGITGQKREDILALIRVLAVQDHNATPLHEVVDTFQKLGKFENLPSQAVSAAAMNPTELENMKAGLSGWKRYFIDCFKKDEFFDLPQSMREQSSMWRCSTYADLLSDTIDHGGTIMATVLSLAFKPRTVVEMGVDGGITTLQFCRLNPEARVYGVDKFSRKRGAELPIGTIALMQNVPNLTIHIGDSWDFEMPGQVGLCFIDGEHCGDAPMKDTRRAWENRNADGDWCIAWDDYDPNNPDVYQAVNEFCAEVGMPMNRLGSWSWIGSKSAGEVQQFAQ